MLLAIITTNIKNRKINIEVIKLISIMANTTISVSEKFHEWLKGKGRKGESYEDVIKKMLRQEFLQELESSKKQK